MISRYFLILLSNCFLFLSIEFTYGAEISEFKNEVDSLNTEIINCQSDTCKFQILYNHFWKLRSAGFTNASYYGRWAYEVIKNSNKPKQLANGYDVMSIILREENKIDSAAHFLTKALKIAKQIKYDFRITWCNYSLGEIADLRSEPEKAITFFKIAAEHLTDSFFIWQAHEKIADNFQKLGLYDSSIVWYKKTIKSFKDNRDKTYAIYSGLNLSICYKYINNIKESSECLRNALSLAESQNNKLLLAHVYWEIGKSFSVHKKNQLMARSYYNKALELAETLKLYDLESKIYSQISTTYCSEENYVKAIEYNLLSIETSEKLSNKHYYFYSLMYMGFTYRKWGKNNIALKTFEKCLQNRCTCCPELNAFKVQLEIGHIYLEMQDFDKAYKWYKKVLNLALQANAKTDIAKSKFSLGNFYFNTNQFDLAETYYIESIQLAKELKDILLIKDIADSLGSFFQQMKKYQSAIKYIKLAAAMKDSLSEAEQQASMANLEMNFEFQQLKKDNELKAAKSNDEIERQRIFMYLLVFICILLSVLGAFILFSYRRKQKDNALLELQKKEISTQKDEIEKISMQLHDADQSKLKFFTNISHELRTPLTLIISPLAKLFKKEQNEENKMIFSVMHRNAFKLQKLLNQLLEISKLDKGEVQLNLKAYNLSNILKSIAAMFQSISEEKNISYRIIERDKNIICLIDAEKVDQIVSNLLSNAFKFTPEGGNISMETGINNDFIEIIVKDDGIGIPRESIEKIFDRFYQCKTKSTRDFEGSGIGLSLTKELVELHNGKISVYSEEGKHTEFRVLLPFISNGENQIEENYSPAKLIIGSEKFDMPDKLQSNNKLTRTILLVEDNSDLQLYISSFLSGEFNMLIASNGKEGIELANKNIPDIIISDVMMPEADGYELTAAIKNNIKTSHIPVILITAKAERDSKIEGLEKGADDYIIKPFDEDELILKIRNILQSRIKLQEKYRKQITVNPSLVEVNSLDEQFLIKLTLFIEKNLANTELDVSLLCINVGLSRTQLFKKLKALTDLSISQFIRKIRLKRAAQLLEKKYATVSEIAYSTGFENLSYFTRKFKEEFGKLPSEF